MAYRCFKLALSTNNDHAEAYNNLGVLEWRRGRGEQVSEGHMTIMWLIKVLIAFHLRLPIPLLLWEYVTVVEMWEALDTSYKGGTFLTRSNAPVV